MPNIAVALRAPEVVLKSSFDHRIDIWSFACYLFEVFTGQPLFNLSNFNPGQYDDDDLLQMNDDDHLLQMISTLGPLPPAMFERWPRRMRYFDANLDLIRTDVGKSEIPLGAIHVGDTLEQRFRKRMPRGMTEKEETHYIYILRSALQYDPTNRPSAAELLNLDWP